MQLNDPANYARYHLVTLCEKMLLQHYTQPMNTLILGCTHYPYLKDTIAEVLNELYNFQSDGTFRYRAVLAEHVELIDPALETAKQAYVTMRSDNLQEDKPGKRRTCFYQCAQHVVAWRTTANRWLVHLCLQIWPHRGRQQGLCKICSLRYKNISAATYARFKMVLPDVYKKLQLEVKGIN